MRLNEIFGMDYLKNKFNTFKQKMRYDDSKVKNKAGLLPYFKHPDGTIEFLFMVSSNPHFGGPDPMISKGGVDAGEDMQKAAKREGVEELGLRLNNISTPLQLIYNEQISGLENTYHMTFFMCGVKNKNDFGQFHYETARTVWMTNDQFQAHGRKSHRPVVQRAFNLASKG